MPRHDFQALKVLKYDTQLQQIAEGKIPDPIMLEIDPCDFCNFGCSWCSSGHHLWEEKRPKHTITMEQFDHILKFIDYKKSVKGCYFVGGGEPTLNRDLPKLMEKTKSRGIYNYITNNGSNLSAIGEQLVDLCQWVAVSVNSGSETHWRNVFKTKMSYEKYLDGCKKMNTYNKSSGRNIEITYKHTYDPETFEDIEKAYFLAIELGFTNVLIKPVDMFIYKRENAPKFSEVWPDSKVMKINAMIQNIKNYNKVNPVIELDCGGFYGNISEIEKGHNTPHTCQCWTSMLDPVFGADGNIHICCVRRSERTVGRWDDGNLCQYWGSQEHITKVWGFNPNTECPTKCKNKGYNKIVQEIYIDKQFSVGHI